MGRGGRIALVVLALLGVVPPGVLAQEPEPIVYSAYRYGRRRAGSAIFTIVPGGERQRLTGSRSFNLQPVWSPDRTRIAYVHHARPRNPDIWVMNADGSEKVRLTTGPLDDAEPRWSPDGERIAWIKSRPDLPTGSLFVMNVDGSEKRALTGSGAVVPRWSPDGRAITFMYRPGCDNCTNDAEIHVVDLDGSNERSLTDNQVDDSGPVWSPDGERIAFARMRDGGADLFSTLADGSDERRLTSLEGYAFIPEWSPDGSEIAFTLVTDAENFHTRVGVTDVASGEARLLTDTETGGILPHWSPDGGRIAFLGFHAGAYNVGVVGRDGSGLEQVTRSEIDEFWVDW